MIIMTGTVYLICFDRPYRHARHYCGWSGDLDARLAQHRAGNGARLLKVITGAGIGWRVTRTWEGTRDLERQLKRRHEGPRLCPSCRNRAHVRELLASRQPGFARTLELAVIRITTGE